MDGIDRGSAPVLRDDERGEAEFLEADHDALHGFGGEWFFAAVDGFALFGPVDDGARGDPRFSGAEEVDVFARCVTRFWPHDLAAAADGLDEEAAAGGGVAVIGGAHDAPGDAVTNGFEVLDPGAEDVAFFGFDGAAFGIDRAPGEEFFDVFDEDDFGSECFGPANDTPRCGA